MNPYLEEVWSDAHSRLLVYACDQIQRRLPPDLRARIEHHLRVQDDATGQPKDWRADVAVEDSWRLAEDEGGDIAVATPVVVDLDLPELRYLKIIENSGRVVTVIELFSPSNKLKLGERFDFEQKRQQCVTSGIAFVQIDLLLQGEPVLHEDAQFVLQQRRAPYHVATHGRLSDGKWRVYPIRLAERLPAVAIPLRPDDKPAPLELQRLLDVAFETGAYDTFDYRQDPPGPLSDADRAWLDEHLRQQGLR
jgi:hypothetical protein